MASIDLPQCASRLLCIRGKRLRRAMGVVSSITFAVRFGRTARLDRLQWWYHLSTAKEMALGGCRFGFTAGPKAVERFSVHIERWLHNTRQDLYGNGSIPLCPAPKATG